MHNHTGYWSNNLYATMQVSMPNLNILCYYDKKMPQFNLTLLYILSITTVLLLGFTSNFTTIHLNIFHVSSLYIHYSPLKTQCRNGAEDCPAIGPEEKHNCLCKATCKSPVEKTNPLAVSTAVLYPTVLIPLPLLIWTAL